LRSYRGQIYWESGDSGEPADETALSVRADSELAWHGEAIWRLPQWHGTFVFGESVAGDSLALPASVLMRVPLVARSRRGGERMRCDVDGPSRTLKNLFQERGVPAWKRDVPLLYVGDTLLFVPLIGVNRAALTANGTDPNEYASTTYVRIEWREDLLIA
jgi:tRNA(Ile)-lysidine synthase